MPIRKIIILLTYLFTYFKATAQNNQPIVSRGMIERLANFKSEFVTARNIDIWLPEGYSAGNKYPVLYMQDGQMLFDSSITWNKQCWQADEVAGELIASNKIRPFIIVGIWNGGETRHPDYFPQKPFVALSQQEKEVLSAQLTEAGRTKGNFIPRSDDYLKFITRELKPYIDSQFSVYTDRANTFIAGSSMGGLISLYAICEYPDIFGGVACISTHWPGSFSLENNPFPDAMMSYLSGNLPDPADHKIYFDCGDQTLDALYPALQQRIDSLMSQHGYSGSNWLTGYFPGEDHSERSWAKRLNIPLEFFFKY